MKMEKQKIETYILNKLHAEGLINHKEFQQLVSDVA